MTLCGVHDNMHVHTTVAHTCDYPLYLYRHTSTSSSKGDKQVDKDVVKNDVLCPVCHDRVQDEDEALTCDICSNWYHVDCQNVPTQVYQYFVGNDASSQLHWYCKACNVGAANLMHMLNNSRDKLEKQIQDVDKKVENMDSTSQRTSFR